MEKSRFDIFNCTEVVRITGVAQVVWIVRGRALRAVAPPLLLYQDLRRGVWWIFYPLHATRTKDQHRFETHVEIETQHTRTWHETRHIPTHNTACPLNRDGTRTHQHKQRFHLPALCSRDGESLHARTVEPSRMTYSTRGGK